MNLESYKRTFHVSVNFFSIFLLITFIPDFVGINSSIVTNSFWALKAVFAILVIANYHRRLYQIDPFEKLFFFVVFVYISNMFVDIFLQNYTAGMGSTKDFISFCVSILIALSFRYDPVFSSDNSYKFFIITLSAGLIIAYFFAVESKMPGMSGRFGANSTVNTINYGQMGCTLCIMSMYGFMSKKFRYSKFIFIALLLLGLISIAKAGSRSPIVVLAVVSIIYFLARSGFIKGLVIIFCAIAILWSSLGFLIEFSQSLGSSLPARILSAVETGESSGRDVIYTNTLNHIKNSWFFGDFYLIPSGVGKNGYPHNFFLEAFLTTGFLGGIPFLMMTFIALYKAFKLLKHRHSSSWIILMFLQLFVYGMFSSALYSSQDFWALCLFVLSAPALTTESSLVNGRRKVEYSS